jgi:hypothetical protein
MKLIEIKVSFPWWKPLMEKVRKVICVLFGHPPVVRYCFGEVTCHRCHEYLGDTLGGVYDLKGQVIAEHECDECCEAEKKLTWKDKFLTPSWHLEEEEPALEAA